jgi:hypothetical protein
MLNIRVKLLVMTALLGLQLTTPLAVAQASGRAVADRADIDATARKTLRDGRILVRDAKRLQSYQVVQSGNDLLGALRQFKLAIDGGASIEELQDLQPELEQLSHLLHLKVDQAERARPGILSSDYAVINRDIRYLAVLLGLNDRDDPVNPGEERGIYIEAAVGTAFKISVAQSSSLPSSQKCAVNAGDLLVIADSSEDLDADHVKVKLIEAIPGCDFGSAGRVGYVYGPHFRYVD